MSADQDGEITKAEFQKQLRKVQVSEHACCPMFISRKATIENVEILRQLCMASFRECMSTQCNEKNKHERPKQFKLDNPTDGSKMATTGMFELKQFQLKVEDHFIAVGAALRLRISRLTSLPNSSNSAACNTVKSSAQRSFYRPSGKRQSGQNWPYFGTRQRLMRQMHTAYHI